MKDGSFVTKSPDLTDMISFYSERQVLVQGTHDSLDARVWTRNGGRSPSRVVCRRTQTGPRGSGFSTR